MKPIENRREFLLQAAVAAIFPFLPGCAGDMLAKHDEPDALAAIKKNAINDPRNEWWGAKDAPANTAWTAKIAADAEPGERIAISGTVFLPDGKTPAPNTLIYLYHTDIHGIYGREGEHRHGRYRGWMLTDAQGRFRFETIKPASYPNSTVASHIHMTATTADLREDWIDSVLFEGDRFITPRERTISTGGFNHVLKLAKANNGILTGVRDIRLWA
ncbi:MAG: hypothetical protein AB7F88_06770 [Pyrinomonadaceae bacterium]